jgi:ribonuclease E
MYQPVVQLKSGGYLVINPTEALVSIDINSGRSTREHNIEQTAFATNIEAAAEIARQLRLRDMAGLIVIDFIDMEQSGHVRKVEKAMKEALKNDRARIQVGRISSFGLMEMSRQRLRTGVLEASTKACPHCEGTGLMRTAASAGLSALRIIEDEAARGRGDKILLRAGRDAAVYVLNKKRAELAEIERRYGVSIDSAIDESFEGAKMSVESSGPKPHPAAVSAPVVDSPEEEEDERDAALVGTESEEDEDEGEGEDHDEDQDEEKEHGEAQEERHGRRRRRRRRGGRGRRRGGQESTVPADELPPPIEEVKTAEAPAEAKEAEEADEKPKKSRRRRKPKGEAGESEASNVEPDSSPMVERPTDNEPAIAETEAAAEDKPKPKRSRRKKAAAEEPAPPEAPPAETAGDAGEQEAKAKPKRRTRKPKASEETAEPAPDSAPMPTADNDSNGEEPGEPRRGWWQRTFG